MKHVLAIDAGTTGITCLVVSEEGKIVGRGYREITQYFPKPGWVEHDAAEIFSRTLDSAREALSASGVVPDTIGITCRVTRESFGLINSTYNTPLIAEGWCFWLVTV